MRQNTARIAPQARTMPCPFPEGRCLALELLPLQRGGTVVDFAAAIWGIPERDAAIRLANDEEIEQAVVIPQESKRVCSESLATAIDLLLVNGHTSVRECFDYLGSRGISERTTTQAVRRGLLRFLPADPFKANKMLIERLGSGLLSKSGFLKPGARWPGIAFRPMVSFFPVEVLRISPGTRSEGGRTKAIRYGHVKWPLVVEGGQQGPHDPYRRRRNRPTFAGGAGPEGRGGCCWVAGHNLVASGVVSCSQEGSS